MEEHDMRKKVEIENAKVRLKDTKTMIAETLTRISKTEAEHQDEKLQYSKKLNSFQSIQGNQNLKIGKLNNDIRVLEGMLQSRKDEERGIQNTNVHLKEELQNLQEETVTMKSEFSSKLEALEDSIKMGYLQLQNDKEAEVLLEVGLSSLKPDEDLPFVEKVLNKTLEAKRRREKELKEELSELEYSQRQAKKDIQAQTELLSQLKNEYSKLIKIYNQKKKPKEDLPLNSEQSVVPQISL